MLVLDATAKPNSGYFEGNFVHFGHYDECVNIQYTNNNTARYGKYCLASITLANNDSVFGKMDLVKLYKLHIITQIIFICLIFSQEKP